VGQYNRVYTVDTKTDSQNSILWANILQKQSLAV